MQYQYNEEQMLFKDSLRKFAEANYSYEARCALANTTLGYSEDHWRQLAELGVMGLALPENMGGFDGGLAMLCAAAEEVGRGLILEPVLATAIAAEVLVAGGSDALRQAWLPKVATGDCKLSLAWEERGTRGDPRKQECRATSQGDQFLISGDKIAVLAADSADRIIVSARLNKARIGLFLVDPASAGLILTAYPLVGGGRAANLQFNTVAAQLIAVDGMPGLQRGIDRALVMLSAQAVGAMDALLAATLDYLKTRKQFGVPIASFQALQHRMADMYIACEKTRSLMWAAVQADQKGEGGRAAARLKAQIGEGGRYVGQQAIQLHGGIGMTEELNVGAYFKLLTALDALYGNRDYQLSTLAGEQPAAAAGSVFNAA